MKLMNKTDKDIEKLLIDDDRISMYLQGKMNADEETSFMEELKTNEDLRQRAIAQARLIKGMKQADEEFIDTIKKTEENDIIKYIEKRKREHKKERFFQLMKKRKQMGYGNVAVSGWGGVQDDEDYIDSYSTTPISHIKESEEESAKPKTPFFRWLSYAASILLIVFIGFKGYDYYRTVNLGKQYATTFVLSEIVRGEVNVDVEEELRTLFENVTNGKDLSKTTERLDVIWQIAKQDTYNDYTNYAPYIGWYLAIGYLRDYEKLKANKILVEMNEMYSEHTVIGTKIEEVMKECDL